MKTQIKMTRAESRVPALISTLAAAALVFVGALAGLIFLAADSNANTVTVSWQPVSADPNGTPVTLTQYTVYYANNSLLSYSSPGAVPGSIPMTKTVVQPSNTSTQLTLGPGTYYFRVTASDSAGESSFDTETVDVSTTIASVSSARCNVTGGTSVTIQDAVYELNAVVGINTCTASMLIDGGSACNIADVQRILTDLVVFAGDPAQCHVGP